MAVSPINYCLKKNIIGLTLIEVLIALAIMSIAMTAVIKATSQNIRNTAYLQNKTVALWLGKLVMNEARLGLLVLPRSSAPRKEMRVFLEREWYWQAKREETPNKRIDKIEVDVFDSEEEASPLISLESYVYHEATS